MTPLHARKSRLVLETSDTVRERCKLREVVLEAHSATPCLITVRLKGTRTRFTVEASAIYHFAAKLRANQLRAEKCANRRP